MTTPMIRANQLIRAYGIQEALEYALSMHRWGQERGFKVAYWHAVAATIRATHCEQR